MIVIIYLIIKFPILYIAIILILYIMIISIISRIRNVYKDLKLRTYKDAK